MKLILTFSLFLFLILNLCSQNDFLEHIIIDNSKAANGASCVYAGDIDGDGDLDVISGSRDDFKVAWYENIDGTGAYGQQKIISIFDMRPSSIVTADVDGDGDLDVITAGENQRRGFWYKNINGRGEFSPGIEIDYGLIGKTKLIAEDLDGDDDVDLILYSDRDSVVVWHENVDGKGFFGPAIFIDTSTIGQFFVDLTDLDGDGDLDVISAFSSNGFDYISWLENEDGKGSFGKRKIIVEALLDVRSVTTDDIDGDGDPDIIASSSFYSRIEWYENLNGKGDFGRQKNISTGVISHNHIETADVDGDGDIDVLFNSSNNTSWCENMDGKGKFSRNKVISKDEDGLIPIIMVDLNGDGISDLLTASSNNDYIAWYKNNKGNFIKEEFITQSLAKGAHIVLGMDMDGDGDIDAVSASLKDDKIAWYENLDGQGRFGEQKVISSTSEETTSLYAEDMDGDGDLDLIATNIRGTMWHENVDGKGIFSKGSVVGGIKSANSVYASDLDGDQEVDLLIGSIKYDILSWYEKIDAATDFVKREIMEIKEDGINSVIAADIDGDSD